MLVLAGCAGTNAADPSIADVLDALRKTPIADGMSASYATSGGSVKFSLTVEGTMKVPGEGGVPVDTVRVNMTRTTRTSSTSYWILVHRETGVVVGKDEKADSQQSYFQRDWDLRLRLNAELATHGFQLAAGAAQGRVANQVVGLTGTSNVRLTVPYKIVNGSSGDTIHDMSADMFVKFDGESWFPAEFRDSFGLTYERTANSKGSGGALMPVKAVPGDALRFDAPRPWTGVVPPENEPSSFEFSLKDAWAAARANNEQVERYAASHPDARLCGTTYRASHALLPPQHYELGLTICSPDSILSFDATRTDAGEALPDQATPDRVTNVRESPKLTLARGLLPDKIVPWTGSMRSTRSMPARQIRRRISCLPSTLCPGRQKSHA